MIRARRRSRLRFIALPTYGSTIVAAGLRKSRRFMQTGLFIADSKDWF